MRGVLLIAGVLGVCGVALGQTASHGSWSGRAVTGDRAVQADVWTFSRDGRSDAVHEATAREIVILRFEEAAPIPRSARSLATQYGPEAHPDQTIPVGIGRTWFRISPWQPVGDQLDDSIEEQRLRWLRDNGFVGGVRTFRSQPAHARVIGEDRPMEDAPMRREREPRPDEGGWSPLTPEERGVSSDASGGGAGREWRNPTRQAPIEPRARFRAPEGPRTSDPTFRV